MPLTELQTVEAREAFTLFDREGSGGIKTSEISTVLRSLGYTLSSGVLAEMERDADLGKTGFVKIGDFLKQVEKAVALAHASNHEIQRDMPKLLQGIKFFFEKDKKDTQLVSVSDLKNVLTKLGEKLSDEEVSELFRELQVFPGNKVRFNDLVALLTSI